MSSITLSANAKLNLSLSITGRRNDGYHNIVTEMQEIDLCDTVTVTISKSAKSGIYITCDNPEIPIDNRNIAYRAAELFGASAHIHIEKRIPVMAGLGGSSTDGAAVLKALNRLHDNKFSEHELIKMGAALGADVPFCMTGGRAKCEGIGDVITKLTDLPEQYYAIIQPDFACDTRKAYSMYRPDVKQTRANIFQDLYSLSGDERLNEICDELSGSLTGSGSAVFAVFKDETDAKLLLEKLDYPFMTIATNVRQI
jgi:4-diphosphocytidyl-2-C-methyl-D-erythritol kinase